MKPIVTKKLLTFYIETARQKVWSVFLKYPEKEFSLSDIAKEAGVAKAHIGTILNEFYELGLINIIKLSKIWRIKANQQSPEFIKSKVIFNLNFVYQSGLVEFINEQFNNPKAIILFGSFSKGDDISTSDIDIAIESDEVDDYKIVRHKNLTEFENAIGRKLQIHLFNRTNVDLNVFNNIANGIVLAGFLEVKP
ncbi:nucleotidyltransferase domain-containing protein [Candidatus Woesearchaeota archaeon]|nr:nucleotidyltransferase domain-containing protein [Candidatus Woesearchaeota archaeon]